MLKSLAWKTREINSNQFFHMSNLYLLYRMYRKQLCTGKMCLASLPNGYGTNHQLSVLFHGKKSMFNFIKMQPLPLHQKAILFGSGYNVLKNYTGFIKRKMRKLSRPLKTNHGAWRNILFARSMVIF